MRFIFSSLFKNKFTCDIFGKSNPTFVEIYKLRMPYFHLLFRSTVKIKSSPLRDISVRCIAQFEVDRLGERSPKAPPRRTFAVNLCTFFTRNHSSISRGSEIRGIVKRSSIRRRSRTQRTRLVVDTFYHVEVLCRPCLPRKNKHSSHQC